MRIEDHRSTERFLTEPPIHGVVGRINVAICNVGERGLQVEHSEPLSPHNQCTLAFSLPNGRDAFAVTGTIMWSRIFNSGGKYLYRSGIKIDEATPELRRVLKELVAAGAARPDRDSLERKKDAFREKSTQVAGQMFVRRAAPAIPADQAERIREAARQLLASPDDLTRWGTLGRAALSSGLGLPRQGNGGSTDLVLAVWEYLEREADLRAIASILESSGLKR